ncbi:MAG: putative monooxygenase, partial [Frankiales bacterium]|nr:putative monooxygenase [Frankiales bacterium]
MTLHSAGRVSVGRVVIVGASLVGLSTAIALGRRGLAVTVLERSQSTAYQGGGGLGVDLALLAAVTGLSGHPPVCQGIDRATTAWPLLVDWLEQQSGSVAGLEVVRAAEVVEVGPGWVRTADGRQFDGDLVIGADGGRSTVRRWVVPERPDAVYAGYLLWRAMVAERDLPPDVVQLDPDEPSREYYSGPYRLVTYPVPGADGSAVAGRRRLNLVWYDPARSELLTGRGLLEGTTVRGSLAADDLSGELREELQVVAEQRWPSPWREAFEEALRRAAVFATPVVQYRPLRLVRGPVAIVGDAAHAASPMVGGGFRQGLLDAAALAHAFDQRDTPDLADLLRRYEQGRLSAARAHVER